MDKKRCSANVALQFASLVSQDTCRTSIPKYLTLFYSLFSRNLYAISLADQLLAKHFPGESYPPLLELEKNAALGLHFGHPLIMDGLRPIAPNYIYLGMMLCKEPKPLPDDLREFMDNAPDGVIYVSFG